MRKRANTWQLTSCTKTVHIWLHKFKFFCQCPKSSKTLKLLSYSCNSSQTKHQCFSNSSFHFTFKLITLGKTVAAQENSTRHAFVFFRRPDGLVGMALVLPALTDCRWWFESLLVHTEVSSATRRKAMGADQKKIHVTHLFVSSCTQFSKLFFLVSARCLSAGRTWDSRVDQQGFESPPAVCHRWQD